MHRSSARLQALKTRETVDPRLRGGTHAPEHNFEDAESRGVLYTRRCASPWSIIFDFDKRNNFYSDYVHMLGKVRVYSPEVMKVAAAWLRKAVRRMSKCVNVA